MFAHRPRNTPFSVHQNHWIHPQMRRQLGESGFVLVTHDQNLASGRPGEEGMCHDVHVVQGGITQKYCFFFQKQRTIVIFSLEKAKNVKNRFSSFPLVHFIKKSALQAGLYPFIRFVSTGKKGILSSTSGHRCGTGKWGR